MNEKFVNSLPSMVVKNKLFKETLWSFLAKGIAFLFFIAFNAFLARNFGPEEFGRWSFLFSLLSSLVLFSSLGIDSSSKKYVAEFNKTKKLSSVLVSSVKLRFLFSLLFCFTLLLIYKQIAQALGMPDFEELLLISIPFVFFMGLINYLNAIFSGLHRLKYIFILNALEYGLKFFMAFLFLLAVSNITSVLYALTLSSALCFLIGSYLLYSHFFSGEAYRQSFKKKILKYSVPLFIISLNFIAATELDTLMIGVLNNNREVGAYVIAKKTIDKLPHLSLALAAGTMPIFAKVNSKNILQLKNKFFQLLRLNGLIFGIISFLILTTGWYLIPLIFGEEYSRAILPMIILIPYLVFFSFNVFLSSFLDYQSLAKTRSIILTISLIVSIGLNVFLIPKFGSIGAAVSASTSSFINTLLMWNEVRKFFVRHT